ncbi:hemagglutinin/hemolysin-like protein [Rhodanobacter fulvus Jip2]|uniref:Hemagglutinin/hemolysin-like protein n=1 Tax=Rhodanobacter fulvus Jip2 TaxID=1163408 RepID=I4VKX8_9GAMM|nr:hypothetical protein [Rhodanobacter fulvus]EIL87869.1 hemagglutinin/hemolysin-like protein [Rhodanobacter fulvus Jip2]
MQLASAAVGGAVGGGAGAVTALDGEKYNRQLHPDYVEHLQSQAKAFAEQECGCTLSQLPQDQQDEWLDNATNALLVTAQRLQDDTFNASFSGAPLDAAAEAFLQTDSFGEWIGGTYYDMSHANAEQRADPNINGYALYQQLNSDDNGGLGALMSATGYSMEQYYVLGRNDYYSGEPQSQAMDEAIYQAQQQSGKDFLNFQGGIIANAFVMATTAGIGNAAMEVYGGTRVGTVLKYALTSRGGMALTNSGINAVAQAAEHDGKINWVDVGTTAATSYLGAGRNLGWNMALGASGGVVGTEYANWSEDKDDSVLASGLTNGLATGIGFGVGDPMTKSLLEKYPGTFWPVAWGNLTGDAITEYVNYKIEQADKLGEKVSDDKSNSSMSK